jgi:hypothetical protein
MQIFQQERDDGLEAKISSSASISYASIAEPCLLNNTQLKNIKSFASLVDSDLYYVQSILVSSSWNKNDDIFDPEEVWAARNTPEDKPTNLEHDENLIIGHITGNWPITEDGYIIDESTSPQDLPEKYHILTGSVIYRAFSSNELKDRSEKLIAEIEDGNKFVSMECFFKGFDYGLIHKSTGEYKVLSRNDSTAYLTKHLRAYGGLGEHDNYKIGRVLRNITFSGKGYVEKPANPESIIFNKNIIDDLFTKKSSDLSIAGVSNNQLTSKVENNIMSSENQVAETIEQVETVAETVVATESAPEATVETSTEVTATENTTTETETSSATEELIASLTAEVEALKAINEAMAKKMKEKEEEDEETEAAKKLKVKEDEDVKNKENDNLKAALEAANEVIAGYKMKEEEMAKKEKKMKRKASLLDCGFDAESAEATVEKFDNLNDEAFEAMTSLFAGKMPPWLLNKYKKEDDKKEDEDTETKEKKKASEDTVDASALDTVEVEETVNLSVSSETSPVDTTRAELIEFVCARLGKKLNKGE